MDKDVAITELEAKFKAIVEKSPNMIFINAGGRVVYANKRCVEVTGYSLEEIYSKKFNHQTLTAPEHKKVVDENFKLHAKGKEIEPYEYSMVTKDGKKLNTILATKLIDYKGKKAIMGTITDITEKKKTENELVESERKYRTLFEQIHDPIALFEVIRNKKGIIVDRIIKESNPAFVQLANAKSAAKIRDKSVKEVLGKRVAEGLLPEVRRAMETGMPVQAEIRVNRQGKLFDFTSVITPISQELYIHRATDITAVMDQDRKKEEFIAVASHELKTPLTSLMVYSEILNSDNVDPKIYLPKMHEQILKLNYLVHELLDVTKLSSDDQPLNIERFSMVKEIKKSIENLGIISSNHKVIFKYEQDYKISADKRKIDQVFSNLLSNAVKYSPKATKVDVSLKVEKSQVVVKVRDYGIGISNRNLNKIFGRFFRVDSGGVSGTGMGLAICQEIIEKHGGKIWVKSQVGKGSTFYFSLPIKK